MIGGLKEQVEILRATRQPDGAGGATLTWQTHAERWAEIFWRTSIEKNTGFRRAIHARARALIREVAELSFTDRLLLDGRHYTINSIITPKAKSGYQLLEIEEVRQ